MTVEKTIGGLVEASRKAQHDYESFDQKQVDALVRAVGKVVFDNAEELARMAVDETMMGIYEDKVKKNMGKARIIWHSLKGKKSVGIIDYDDEEKLYYVAKPKGVIGLVTPCTNPIVTPMCNLMFALKGRNSAVIAPHPRAKECGAYTVKLINQELKKLGAPENLVQIIEEPSLDLTNELMRQVDAVVATGGMAMVRAAYSSGKPSYGVGAGNVQVILDTGIDLEEAAEKIIIGRTFDNGIICSGEQTIITPIQIYDDTIEAFKKRGACYFDDPVIIDKFRKAMFTEKKVMNKELVGQPVEKVAEMAGVDVPEGTRVIILKAGGVGREELLCKEKMCSVMASFGYASFEEALRIAQANLDYEGEGHTVAIHSHDKEKIEKAGVFLNVSRLIVNQTSATSSGGSFFNGFAPTTTLGCGSWGNNSLSENLTYHHLLNISRIGLFKEGAAAPADEELWG